MGIRKSLPVPMLFTFGCKASQRQLQGMFDVLKQMGNYVNMCTCVYVQLRLHHTYIDAYPGCKTMSHLQSKISAPVPASGRLSIAKLL